MPRKGPAPKRPMSWIRSMVPRWLTSWSARSCWTARRPCPEHRLRRRSRARGPRPASIRPDAQEGSGQHPPRPRGESRRVGGATYQVPIEVKPSGPTPLALRWLVSFSRQRREKTMTERLTNEAPRRLQRLAPP